MTKTLHLLFTLLLCAMLAACGTDSSSGDSADQDQAEVASTDGVTVTLPGGSGTGGSGNKSSFSLRLTDAPLDDLLSVVMKFTMVKLRDTDGQWTTYEFDINNQPSIDLLGLQGTKTADLLVNMTVLSGKYDEIRLLVSDEFMANYVEIDSAPPAELKIPSGSSSGLKIKGNFEISDLPASLVIDFDLRQSVTMAGKSGKYIFKPVLRLAENDKVGHIRGTVDPALLSSISDCSDDNVDSFNAVYVYAGHDAITADIEQKANAANQPITTSNISYDNASMSYMYEAAFLPEGDYTIAFTCNADEEDLDKGGDSIKLFGHTNATVVVNNIVFL